MNKVLLFMGFLYLTIPVCGQGFKGGDIVFCAGYGFGNINYLSLQKKTPVIKSEGPFYLKAEVGISHKVGIGVNMSYYSVNGDRYLYYDSTANGAKVIRDTVYGPLVKGYGALLRLNIHFGSSKHIDPYIGIGAGYRGGYWYTDAIKWSGNGPFKQTIGLAASIGVRMFVLKRIGVYAEVGTEKAIVQGGISYRIRL